MSNSNTTELKSRIIEMMTENTGINMLDSGGVDGRGWQRNRLIDDLDKVPIVDVDVCSDNEVIVQYSTYHYLMNFLEITDKSESLNTALKEFMTGSDNPYPEDVMNFIATLDTERSGSCNTYNYDNIIDHVLQYNIFEVTDDEYYIAIQIHLGADVRGGYTVPQIFSLRSDDNATYFELAQNDISACCECSAWSSDDAGATYYSDNGGLSDDTDWTHDTKNNRIICNKCGKEVVFSVTESW